MYGSEAWTLRMADRKKIDSFELWCWRRPLRISGTDKRNNMSVIDEIKPPFPLEALINKQKLLYFGHIMRSKNTLEKSIMLSMVAGRWKRGRPRIKWMDGIRDLTGLNLAELREVVRERQQCRNRTKDCFLCLPKV